MRTALDTPWTLAGFTPALPPRAAGPLLATAAPIGSAVSSAAFGVDTPWAAADVRLPARATALPSLALGPVLPQPRQVIDLPDMTAVRP